MRIQLQRNDGDSFYVKDIIAQLTRYDQTCDLTSWGQILILLTEKENYATCFNYVNYQAAGQC